VANKNILVTGVSRGLGLEITRVLLKEGYNVYGICRTVRQKLSELLKSYENQLFVHRFDLLDIDMIKSIIFGDFLPLDVPIYGFVNNAAIAYDDLITNLHFNELDRMFRINVFSPMMMVKNVIRNMLYHNIHGSIVHISSISVHTGYKGLAMYAASKGALEAFSKNTAREWGEKGIRSNCVVAGFMETDMSASLSKEQKDRIYRRTSLKTPTSVSSVAESVVFLFSDKARSITGHNIFVDSGTI
jgi:3-oxoacyl-[acyl-carrier protein] reductase